MAPNVAGSVPAPVVLGYILDGTCLLWKQGEPQCGGGPGTPRESCWIYDSPRLSVSLTGVLVGTKVATSVSMLLAWLLYKRPQDSSSPLVALEMSVEDTGPAPHEEDAEEEGVDEGREGEGLQSLTGHTPVAL